MSIIRYFIALLMISVPGFGAYSYVRSVTIDHTQVGGSDSTNFPVVITGTHQYLAVVGSGGQVTSASGYDIVFTSDMGCTMTLNFERVFWTSTTGSAEFWVKVPTVSHTTNTIFYLCYGNSSITTDQSNPTAVWPTRYKAVYHMQTGGTAGGTAVDSTGNNTGTVGASSTMTEAPAVIGNGYSTGGSASNDFVDLGTMGNIFNGSNTVLSMSYWFERAQGGFAGPSAMAGPAPGQFIGSVMYSYAGNAPNATDLYYATAGPNNFQYTANNGFCGYPGFCYVLYVLDLSNSANDQVYGNGVPITTVTGTNGTVPTTFNALTNHTYLFREQTDACAPPCILDEVHYANAAPPSADWVLAEYNNQKPGSTFVTISGSTAHMIQ